MATIAKNLVVQSALALVMWRVLRRRSTPLALAVLALLASFTPFQRVSLALVPEEGWLIAGTALLFQGAVSVRRGATLASVAPHAAVAFAMLATKSTMLFVVPVVGVLFAWRARRSAVLALFSASSWPSFSRRGSRT